METPLHRREASKGKLKSLVEVLDIAREYAVLRLFERKANRIIKTGISIKEAADSDLMPGVNVTALSISGDSSTQRFKAEIVELDPDESEVVDSISGVCYRGEFGEAGWHITMNQAAYANDGRLAGEGIYDSHLSDDENSIPRAVVARRLDLLRDAQALHALSAAPTAG